MHSRTSNSRRRWQQNGASLIMVMLILVVVSLLGIGGAQIAIMSERGARSDRDQQVAWQAAEAALSDAEFDLFDATGTRRAAVPFDGKTPFTTVSGCGTSGTSIGLCALNLTGHPAWLDADYTDTSTNAPTTQFGTFTNRTFAAGGAGVQPARAPRYVMEMLVDPTSGDKSNPDYLYRVTAVGFGPRVDIQVMMQILYRI
ncbi:MAG: hypothetical protein IV109_11000 [Rhodoferax sp.]|nr:hypothetical protein [Rhodoferax sp.]